MVIRLVQVLLRGIYDNWRCLHQLPLGRPRLQNIRYRYGRVSVGEVRVVAATRHGDAKTVARNPAQRHMMELPGDPLATLQLKQTMRCV